MIRFSLGRWRFKIGRRFCLERIRWRGYWTPFVRSRRHYIEWRQPTIAEIEYGKQLEPVARVWLARNA